MFPDYFMDMPLTVVAFPLALWQFCIEEWSNGWHQNGDLGTAAMREKYESQLAGLKELRDIAPKRIEKLQEQWRKYVMEYSGAMLSGAEQDPFEGVRQLEMRPDSSELETEDEARALAQAGALALAEALAQSETQVEVEARANNAMSVEEINACVFETGRQASLQERAQQIAAREELENEPDAPMDQDEDEDAEPHAPTPPPAEYNSAGCLTANSKGKGR
ncbi:hypothetical protein BDV93DRAFT_566853 [Ceratobasidium sp. AG-I]|nr:hypothetical protein BDV93DRAFT_566853 [Ceratobasidium sp. AG-I]